VGVDREQTMMVSEASVTKASSQQYQQIMQQAARKDALNHDSEQVQRVRSIAARLIPETRHFRADAPDWHWEVNVLSSDQLNAWCMAGGKIAVYSGLMTRMDLSDDELAAVMGHEIAHALREHARERASRSMVTGIGASIVGAALGIGGLGQDLMGKVAQVTFELPNSRLHETEADRIGVELAARAGYDPRAAVTLWDKMGKVSKGSPPQWLSTHPNHESRQADLAEYAERVMPLYEAARP
jgi:predicted Zn-dependent protease